MPVATSPESSADSFSEVQNLLSSIDAAYRASGESHQPQVTVSVRVAPQKGSDDPNEAKLRIQAGCDAARERAGHAASAMEKIDAALATMCRAVEIRHRLDRQLEAIYVRVGQLQVNVSTMRDVATACLQAMQAAHIRDDHGHQRALQACIERTMHDLTALSQTCTLSQQAQGAASTKWAPVDQP